MPGLLMPSRSHAMLLTRDTCIQDNVPLKQIHAWPDQVQATGSLCPCRQTLKRAVIAMPCHSSVGCRSAGRQPAQAAHLSGDRALARRLFQADADLRPAPVVGRGLRSALLRLPVVRGGVSARPLLQRPHTRVGRRGQRCCRRWRVDPACRPPLSGTEAATQRSAALSPHPQVAARG